MASVAFSSPHALTGLRHPTLRNLQSSPSLNVLPQNLPAFPRLKPCPQLGNKVLSNESFRSRGIAPRCASIPPREEEFVEQLLSQSSLCKCCCTRRTVLTSLGGAIVANVGTEKISGAVESYHSSADRIREAVHPARPGWYEEFYARVMSTTMRSYEAEAIRESCFLASMTT